MNENVENEIIEIEAPIADESVLEPVKNRPLAKSRPPTRWLLPNDRIKALEALIKSSAEEASLDKDAACSRIDDLFNIPEYLLAIMQFTAGVVKIRQGDVLDGIILILKSLASIFKMLHNKIISIFHKLSKKFHKRSKK